MSQNQYDVLAQITEATAAWPVRRHFEEHTFFRALGDITGKTILDVACGTGLYSRRFKERGAARVVGIDNSEGMVGYARHVEQSAPLGIEYVVQDAAEAHTLGTFDIVTATYLLHYAPTKEVLFAMCRNLRASLAPGALLVSISLNADVELTTPSYYHKYDFEIRSSGREGDEVTVISKLASLPFQLKAFLWSKATYESALHEAGLKDLVWHDAAIAPEGIAAHGAEYWDDYVRRPHAVVLSARA
ncbi:Methyltransferase [Minicystis rosea]|nr:Methyltransferase [Minicystis rosea]